MTLSGILGKLTYLEKNVKEKIARKDYDAAMAEFDNYISECGRFFDWYNPTTDRKTLALKARIDKLKRHEDDSPIYKALKEGSRGEIRLHGFDDVHLRALSKAGYFVRQRLTNSPEGATFSYTITVEGLRLKADLDKVMGAYPAR